MLNRRRYEPIVEPGDAVEARFQDPAWIDEEIEDPQLAAAMRTLASKLETDEWLIVGGDPGAEAVASSELRDQMAYRTRLLEELSKTEARILELDGSGASDGDPAVDDETP